MHSPLAATAVQASRPSPIAPPRNAPAVAAGRLAGERGAGPLNSPVPSSLQPEERELPMQEEVVGASP